MAYVKGKSGYFDISGSMDFTARIKWSERYDLGANKSIVQIDGIQFQSLTYGGKFYPGGTVSVNGKTVKTMSYSNPATHSSYVNAGTSWWDVSAIAAANGFPWASAAIDHNSDGTKTTAIAVELELYRDSSTNKPVISGSKTITLTSIPRISTATVPNFTAGKQSTIYINRASEEFKHNLKVLYNGNTYSLASNVATSYSWAPTIATWGSRIPNATVGKCSLLVITKNGDTELGSVEYPFTITIPDSVVPEISDFSVELVNGNSTIQGWGIAVKGFTKLKWKITAAGASGSTIKSYDFSAGNLKGNAASGTTSVLSSAGSVTPSAKATDSRSRTASETAPAITVYNYAAPTITKADVIRCNQSGTATANGTYLKLTITGKISSVNGKNAATYQYRTKQASGSFGSWKSFTSGAVVSGFSTEQSYVVEMRLTDTVGQTVSSSITVATRAEWLHGKDGGKGAAFGKISEEDNLLDVAWDMRVRGNLLLDQQLNFSGKIPLENGGTGRDFKSITASNPYAIVRLSSDPEASPYFHYVNTANGALYAEASKGSPKFGTLPIGQGGTGATKASMALHNLHGLNLDHISTADSELIIPENADLNNYITPGAYRIASSDVMATLVNRPAQSGTGGRLIVSATSSSPGVIQTLIYNSTSGYMFHRVMNNSSTWGNWISDLYDATSYPGCKIIRGTDGYNYYINPPMVLGTEYRAAERWQNNTVFTKLVDCGTLTNGGTYTYSDSTVYPIRYAARTSAGIALPIFMEPALNSTYKAWVDVNTNKITARFASGYSSLHIYCQIWYTKT